MAQTLDDSGMAFGEITDRSRQLTMKARRQGIVSQAVTDTVDSVVIIDVFESFERMVEAAPEIEQDVASSDGVVYLVQCGRILAGVLPFPYLMSDPDAAMKRARAEADAQRVERLLDEQSGPCRRASDDTSGPGDQSTTTSALSSSEVLLENYLLDNFCVPGTEASWCGSYLGLKHDGDTVTVRTTLESTASGSVQSLCQAVSGALFSREPVVDAEVVHIVGFGDAILIERAGPESDCVVGFGE